MIWYDIPRQKIIFNEIRENSFHKNDIFTQLFQNVKYVCPFRSEYFFTLYNLKTTELLIHSLKKSKTYFLKILVFCIFTYFSFVDDFGPRKGPWSGSTTALAPRMDPPAKGPPRRVPRKAITNASATNVQMLPPTVGRRELKVKH